MTEPALSLLNTIREGHSLPQGTGLLVAVSGGADSMVLLHLYTRLREELQLNLAAATFDHGLRGQAGRDDAEFVAEIAQSWGVECMVGRARIDPQTAGVEAQAREARYRFLATCAGKVGATFVATAHHADDQAETVLLNLIRGAGTRGLGGMRERSPLPTAPALTLLRPLLGLRHAELIAYCRAEGIEWREDATNTDTHHRRNWVRQVAIPLLGRANPGLVDTLTRTASVLAEEDAYLDQTVASLLVDASKSAGDYIWIARSAFDGWHPALQKRALLLAARQMRGSFEPDYAHVTSVIRLLKSPEGGTIEWGDRIDVTADTGYVTVKLRGSRWSPPYPGWWLDGGDVRFPGITPDWQRGVPEVTGNALMLRVPDGTALRVRGRSNGDRVYPPGLHGRSQKLKDWLINHKVPQQLRDHLPVIEAKGKIIALWDGRDWHRFLPPFDEETIDIVVMLWPLST